MTSTATLPANKTHLDIHDQCARQNLAEVLGVSEDKLKKAAEMVGTRISTIRGYLGK
jgi:hypothetical protein